METQTAPLAALIDSGQTRSAESTNLDFMRAAAVLCVFSAHFVITITGREASKTWHLGHFGVLMFFVHTSLVLMYSMERLSMTGWSLAKGFYIRRAFRIYPLAIVCTLMAFFWKPPLFHLQANTYRDLATNLTLTQNLFDRPSIIGTLWSLPLEVQMYLALPFLFLFCRKRSAWWAIGILLASIPLALLPSITSERLNILEYGPCFVAGLIAWRLIRGNSRQVIPAWIWPFALAVAGAIWLAGPRNHDLPYRWLCTVFIGLAIPWFRELSWRPLNVASHLIARYSYGIYLLHPRGLVLAHVLPRYAAVPTPLAWTCCLIFSFVLPVALYHGLELPLIRVGRAISERSRSRGTSTLLSRGVSAGSAQ